jgi:hypothetical protein
VGAAVTNFKAGDAVLISCLSFRFEQILEAYRTFGHAAMTHALSVVVEA